jgi:hypothetical protein
VYKKEDIITTKSWKDLCDHVYDAPDFNLPEYGVVWVPCDQIDKFCRAVDGTGRAYIVVSSHSDYGLALQSEHPPIDDLPTTMKRMVNFYKSKGQLGLGYQQFAVPPPCDPTLCNINDKYSIRCYSHTRATIPRIPEEIKHWYLVNNQVENEPRITNIPFGVPEGKEEVFADIAWKKDEDKSLLYVNFADYTFERVELKRYLKDQSWLTYSDQVPFEEYVEAIRSHQFVLCPNGNAIDCYKTLEVIYAGGVPLTEDNATTRGLGIGIRWPWSNGGFDGLNALSVNLLADETVYHRPEQVKLTYWKKDIAEKKRALL